MSTKLILIAATRKFADGSLLDNTSSSDIAAAIIAPYCIKKMELVEFFSALAAAGAVVAEVAPLYQWKRFVDDLEYQLRNPDCQTGTGNYQILLMLVEMAQHLTTMTEPTLAAIQVVIDATARRLVDVVAAEVGEVAPETVTAANVDEALER